MISFGSPLPGSPQSPGPSLLQDAGETFLVAPFWTDYTAGGGGLVRYEVYTPGNAQERLDLVSRFVVNRTSGLETFDASWMILAEWRDRLPSLQGNMNTNQTVSSIILYTRNLNVHIWIKMNDVMINPAQVSIMVRSGRIGVWGPMSTSLW